VTGARLIDGTGAAPIDDAVIIVTGGKFSAVGPRARVTIPPDAEVIDVRGKTITPGLVDGPDGFRAGVRAQLKAGADFIRGREVGRSGRARQGPVGQHCQFANGPDRRPGRSSRETMPGAGNGGAL